MTGESCPTCHDTGMVSRPYVGDLSISYACDCAIGKQRDAEMMAGMWTQDERMKKIVGDAVDEYRRRESEVRHA